MSGVFVFIGIVITAAVIAISAAVGYQQGYAHAQWDHGSHAIEINFEGRHYEGWVR